MEEKDLLNKIERYLKNNHREISPVIYSTIPTVGETQANYYKLMISLILDRARKELNDIKLIYTDASFVYIACLSSLYEHKSNLSTTHTYKTGYLNNVPFYVSPYIKDRVGYILNSKGKIYKFQIID